jgi:hypothetical protein
MDGEVVYKVHFLSDSEFLCGGHNCALKRKTLAIK